MGKIIMDALRSIFWMFASFAMWAMDLIYHVLKNLARLDLGDFNFIWDWFKGLLVLLAFFVIVRMVLHYLRALLSEDEIEKVDPVNLIKRIIILGLILVVLPSTMTALSEVSAGMTDKIGTLVTGVDENVINKPSNIVIATGYDGDLSTFDYKSIDINERVGDQYVLFPNSWDIIMVLAMSIVSLYVLAFIAVQVAQRLVGLLLKILIGPFALSGIVDPSDNTMTLWFKLCVADFLTGFFQILLVMLSLSATVALDVGWIEKAVFYIGALMAVMNAPAGIAQLLGGDVGVGTAFQQMQSMMMIGQGMNATFGAVKSGLALGAYGLGRGMGGTSMLNGIGRGGDAGGGSDPSGGGSGGGFGGGMGGFGGGSGGIGEQASPYDTGGGSGGGSESFGSGAGGYSREGTFANRVADAWNGNPFGRMAVRAGTSMYSASARRLSRPRTVRSGSTVYQKNSRTVGAAHLVHGVADSFRGHEQ